MATNKQKYMRAYYLKNRDRILANKRRTDGTIRKGRTAEQVAKNNARLAAWRRRRRPDMDRLRRSRLRELGGNCACCGLREWWCLTIDHIIPRTLGGTDEDFNLQVLCSGCNSRKFTSGRCRLDHGERDA